MDTMSTPGSNRMSQILDFYCDRGTDGSGRTFNQVLALSDDEFEQCHDFIQYLFGSTEPSRAQPQSPVLTDTDIEEFRDNPILQIRMLQAMVRAMEFYSGTNRWLRPYDHNHLRITRILKFLMLVGHEKQAKDFLTWVLERTENVAIPEHTEQFWILAVYPDTHDRIAGFSGP